MSGRPWPPTQKVLNDRIGQVKGKNGKIWPTTAELRKLFSLGVSRDSVKLSLTCVSWTSGGDCSLCVQPVLKDVVGAGQVGTVIQAQIGECRGACHAQPDYFLGSSIPLSWNVKNSGFRLYQRKRPLANWPLGLQASALAGHALQLSALLAIHKPFDSWINPRLDHAGASTSIRIAGRKGGRKGP